MGAQDTKAWKKCLNFRLAEPPAEIFEAIERRLESAHRCITQTRPRFGQRAEFRSSFRDGLRSRFGPTRREVLHVSFEAAPGGHIVTLQQRTERLRRPWAWRIGVGVACLPVEALALVLIGPVCIPLLVEKSGQAEREQRLAQSIPMIELAYRELAPRDLGQLEDRYRSR